MQTFLMILFMGVVGAIIGGLTNSIAIKMLFRPYEAKYIGNWRLPFTPGLIPKRREELAKQMGLLVMNHLLTPNVIQQRLSDGKIQKAVQETLERKVIAFFQSEKSLEEWLKQAGFSAHYSQIDAELHRILQHKFYKWKAEHSDEQLNSVIPNSVWDKIEGVVPHTTDYLLKNVKQFIMSPIGYDLMKQYIDRFFEGRGMILGMLQSFLDNRNIIERLQHELVKIIENEQTVKAVNQVLHNELDKVKTWTVAEGFEKLLGKEGEEEIWDQLKKRLTFAHYFETPMDVMDTSSVQNFVTDSIIPISLQKLFEHLSGPFIEKMMKKLDVPELVKNQVDSFSTERLEEMVLEISSRELKMITYLGAYLGGIIGIFQGLFVILIG